jgi:thioredoxin 1
VTYLTLEGGGVIKEITDLDFDKEVLEYELPVFACFTARWCRTCYPACLIAADLTEEYKGRVKFVGMNIKENPGTIERYHVTVVPTILIFKDSQPVKRLISFQESASLKSALDSVLVG